MSNWQWTIWYANGVPVSNLDCEPDEVDERDVQVITKRDSEAGWVTVTGCDYYVFDLQNSDRNWTGVDLFGLWDYLASPGWKRVLFGRMVTNNEYDGIMTRALSDPELPEKTSGGRGERWVRK